MMTTKTRKAGTKAGSVDCPRCDGDGFVLIAGGEACACAHCSGLGAVATKGREWMRYNRREQRA